MVVVVVGCLWSLVSGLRSLGLLVSQSLSLMQRLRVLISAHEFSPIQGSECAEGWNLVTRIARYHDVTVLYARGSQFAPDAYETAVNEWIAKNGNGNNIEFIAVPQPKTTLWLAAINKRISKKGSSIGLPFLYLLGYRLWQKAAYKRASFLFRLSPFALVHHLTSINFREPGYLWKLPVPFVWGPTGGTLTIPVGYHRHMGLRQSLYEIIRFLSNLFTLAFSRRIIRAIQKSTLIYTFSEKDRQVFEKKGAGRVEIMLDAGCELQVAGSMLQVETCNLQRATCNRLHVLWVGQLIRRKALDILLKAVAGDEELRKCLDITVIGDGPLRGYYERLARRCQYSVDSYRLSVIGYPLNETNNRQPTTDNQSPVTHHSSLITFLGQLPRTAVFEHMRLADVLVHTSYREATSNVIPEALSCGLPVICHDISGMAIAVTDECGIKVPLKTYHESIRGFREALRKLCSDRYRLSVDSYPLSVIGYQENKTDNRQLTTDNSQLTTSLRSAALRRAEELSWDSMAERIVKDYESIAH